MMRNITFDILLIISLVNVRKVVLDDCLNIIKSVFFDTKSFYL